MIADHERSTLLRPSRLTVCAGALTALYGFLLSLAGSWLVTAGGSAYFLFAGLGTLGSGLLIARGRAAGLLLYLFVLAGSAFWAVSEAGLAPWLLAPRLGAPLAVGLLAASPWYAALLKAHRRKASLLALILAGAGVAGVVQLNGDNGAFAGERTNTAIAATDWPHFANGNDGQRHAVIGQITPANVSGLELAWAIRTGEDPEHRPLPTNLPSFQSTPLKIGETLYLCTPRNQVIAIDAASGKERWRFDPKLRTTGHYLLACRGVAHHRTAALSGACASRIFSATADGKLIALDANTGKLCQGFGQAGIVSLLRNLGPLRPGSYGVTSAPLVASGVVIVGAQVLDNVSTDAPSGVIRAYDAQSGQQLWAFDTGANQPTNTGEPSPDFVYTRGSPNSWAPMSADEELGLVYVPTGNASPDYANRQRSAAMNRYASSVLALDLGSGALRWSFQTVHRDLWDYDVPAQPVLADWRTPGGTVLALIQPTKRGVTFVLDRRTGQPLAPVTERPVPQGGSATNILSPTQPFMEALPDLGPARRTEAAMWGVTPFDQIWCRVKFRQARYQGRFTPPSLAPTIQSPNQTGASNWGRVSFDPARNILIANTVNLDSIVQLHERKDIARLREAGLSVSPQEGTAYGASFRQFLSPLGIPCNAPPWGEIRAIDLKTARTIWRRPFGTVRDRLPVPLAIPLGMPSVGGPLTTAAGLTFIGAADDGYFRAYETLTGRELWRRRLPASAQAAPMTYVTSEGRQYVVIVAGGDMRLGTRTGDYVVAFALPASAKPGRRQP